MTLVRWRDTYNPFADLVPLRSIVNRLFDDAAGSHSGTEYLTRWYPAVDIVEKEDGITISAELPGIEQKDIGVEVHDGTLTIRGEKKSESESGTGAWHRVERTYGAFERSFALPAGVKEEDIKATFKNGVLEVRLPKAEEAKPKKVSVEITGE